MCANESPPNISHSSHNDQHTLWHYSVYGCTKQKLLNSQYSSNTTNRNKLASWQQNYQLQ